MGLPIVAPIQGEAEHRAKSRQKSPQRQGETEDARNGARRAQKTRLMRPTDARLRLGISQEVIAAVRIGSVEELPCPQPWFGGLRLLLGLGFAGVGHCRLPWIASPGEPDGCCWLTVRSSSTRIWYNVELIPKVNSPTVGLVAKPRIHP